jgi:hypothetical protein
MAIARWLPIAMTALVVGWQWRSELVKPEPNIYPLIFVSVIAFGILAWVLSRGIWRHADEVLDAGDALIVRKGRSEDRIPLIDVSAMSISNDFGATTIVLHLSTPTKLGREVSFLADSLGVRWKTSPIAAELAAKIQKAGGSVA